MYWLRLLRLFLVALAVALFFVPFMLGMMSTWGITHPPCLMGGSPGSLGMSFEAVVFPSAHGITQEGFFVPGSSGATIIVVPAYNGGRGAQLRDVQVFHNAGFTVLTFNSRSCTAQGWVSLGYQEVEDVQAAYNYLKTRSDVDPARVALHGFSSAGATSLMAMPLMPDIRSVSAEGGYHNYPAMLGVGQADNFFDALYQQGSVLGYRLVTGTDMHNLDPLSAIGSIGPRPVLLVYGSREVSLPGARLMLERALQNGVKAELWVVEGAGHGDYLDVAPDEFERRVAGFHQAALLEGQS